MIIFVAFVFIVLLGLVIQWLSKRWQAATGIPCVIFATLVLTNNLLPGQGSLVFTLGLPMVFFAALLGSFVYETRLNPKRYEGLSNDEEPHNEEGLNKESLNEEGLNTNETSTTKKDDKLEL